MGWEGGKGRSPGEVATSYGLTRGNITFICTRGKKTSLLISLAFVFLTTRVFLLNFPCLIFHPFYQQFFFIFFFFSIILGISD